MTGLKVAKASSVIVETYSVILPSRTTNNSCRLFGTRLASASWDETAKAWDLTRSAATATFVGHGSTVMIVGIAMSLDGETVFTAGDDDRVRQWDADTGAELRSYSGEGKDLFGLALSPDGRVLAVGNRDGEVTLWDVASGDKLWSRPGHAGLVLRLAFSADGGRLASAGFDRYAKVWDVPTGDELFTLYGNLSNVYGVSISPDGKRLATAGADGTVRLFAMELEEPVALAQARLTRDLTADECRRYLHADACR